MNVLFCEHGWPPYHLAGSEMYEHRLAKWLIKAGHTVKVATLWNEPQVYEGVEILKIDQKLPPKEQSRAEWEWADVVITGSNVQEAYVVNKVRMHDKKVIHICHNQFEKTHVRNRIWNSWVVYNAEHCKRILNYPQDSFVMFPPVDYRDYQKIKGDKKGYITLINHCAWKGGEVLIELAKRMPDKQFLGVKGSYYKQLTADLPNLTYLDKTTDISSFLAKTAILIMPSHTESWGQTAIEAAACGIPVVASKAKGLLESLDYAGVFADRHPTEEGPVPEAIVDGWEQAIRHTYKNYAEISAKCRQRAKELDPIPQLNGFVDFLERVHKAKWVHV